MGELRTWTNTTHDWSMTVDQEHLRFVRDHAAGYTATGVLHLVLEVLAYADDEAESLGRLGQCTVTTHTDGSISVADDGRGTDTRRGEDGTVIRKPVMATKDLRFFEGEAPVLPDGHPRRGMSVVAAVSRWLDHTNDRPEGSWTQRYEYGLPVAGLLEVPAASRTGTTVRFLPDPTLVADDGLDPSAYAGFRWLDVRAVRD